MFEDPTFWVAVAFVIIVAGVFRPAARTLLGALDNRSARIAQQLDEAQKLREEAQKTLAEYKRMQRDAVKESERIIASAKSEAQSLRSDAENKLKEQLARREKLALEKIDQAEANAVEEVRGQAVDLAIAATARLLTSHVDGSQGDQLIDRSIEDLEAKLH